MRKLYTALAGALAVLALAGSAPAALIVGVNDDAPKDAGVAPWFYSTMSATGLALNNLTIRWDEGAPNDIPGQTAVEQAIAKAKAAGIAVELNLYPLHSQVFSGGSKCSPSSDPESCGNTSLIQQFASWTASVAAAFPSVHQFVVMNECNQPLFVNPQFDSSGQNQSAEVCGRALAAAYDALKSASASNFVWGVGLSPRGNDSANAPSNSSTSPVKFLQALGTWFAAFASKTNRTRPLMDGLDFHPYPVPQNLPFAQGYSSPLSASVSNLARIYQAFYDGFKGTPQKTIGQQAGGGLPVSLNETGIQTAIADVKAAAYQGVEVSATAAGGVLGDFATESYQANWYLQMLNLVACDPNVQVVNIFHLIDESALAGWQSGLYFADQTPKQSASTVQNWIAQTHGNCQGSQTPFTASGAAPAPVATTTTTPSTPAKGPAKPAALAPVPKGCVGTCAKVFTAAQTACAAASAAKATCTQALAAAQKQLGVLQKQLKTAKGKAKTDLTNQIAAYKKALATGQAAAGTGKAGATTGNGKTAATGTGKAATTSNGKTTATTGKDKTKATTGKDKSTPATGTGNTAATTGTSATTGTTGKAKK